MKPATFRVPSRVKKRSKSRISTYLRARHQDKVSNARWRSSKRRVVDNARGVVEAQQASPLVCGFCFCIGAALHTQIPRGSHKFQSDRSRPPSLAVVRQCRRLGVCLFGCVCSEVLACMVSPYLLQFSELFALEADPRVPKFEKNAKVTASRCYRWPPQGALTPFSMAFVNLKQTLHNVCFNFSVTNSVNARCVYFAPSKG